MGCVMCTPLDDVCNVSLRPRRRKTMELAEFPQSTYQKFIYLPSIREELLPIEEHDGGLQYGTS